MVSIDRDRGRLRYIAVHFASQVPCARWKLAAFQATK